VALRCVWELYEAVSVPIIGCGGVSTADEVIEMMMAGASAVEIGTAVVGGPEVFRQIADDLYSEDGESPANIVGCAHA
jgi:dihydroorotate dehydrogenase (NAD+) catalytic subunit